MGSLWSREPAAIIGAFVAFAITIVGAAFDQGIISEVVSGRLTDILNAGGALIAPVVVFLTALGIRQTVYSPASYEAK
jgi:hypothetical protein